MLENPADIFDAFIASTTTENRQIFQEDVRAVKSASCMLCMAVFPSDTILYCRMREVDCFSSQAFGDASVVRRINLTHFLYF